MQPLPERAAFGRRESRVAFAGKGREFFGVVGGVLFGGSQLRLAGTAILHVIEERLKIGGGNPRGGSVGEF